ncbi:HTH domain-containing protein [Lactiplantibacillus garii]|uniref:HTH domain-containing protein n=1 Tax=Lactiplantibacillus garii TaxID=2306423 RepID=A0A426D4A0_9LACO|nr:HTH domain-containing protein [Lactiplantibacillus garii]RRK09493.1 HTH domain-containing protein [Lactiplantibacillus garii]
MDRQNFEMLNFFINNDALTLRELQTHFSISRVTITKNIREINEYLDGVAQINVNQSKFYLVIKDYSAIAKLQTTFLKQDLDFNDPAKRQVTILKELLRNTSNYVIVDDLAESLSVSRGTINKDLRELKQMLDFYNVRIATKTNKGIRLEVNADFEYAVITRNLVGKYYELESTWDSATDAKLTNLIKQLDSSNDTVTMVKRNLAVIKWLRKYDIQVNDKVPNYHQLLSDDSTEALRDLLTETIGNSLSPGEWDFISYPLNIKKLATDDKVLVKLALADIQGLMQVVFPIIKQKLDINLDFDRLLMELRYHLLFLINRAIFDVKSEGFISVDMLNKYPVSTELAQFTLSSIAKKLNIRIRKQEVGYLTVYFQMELEEYMSAPVIHRVALVKPISNSMKRFITEQLTDALNDDLQIDIFNSKSDLEKSPEKYLLIFSNSFLPGSAMGQHTPIIRLNSVFNQGALRERLQISLVDEAISHGLCKFDVTKFMNEKSYTKGVRQLINQEITDGQLNEEFLEDWAKREELSSSIFGDGVALPHVIDKSGLNRILVTVGLFEKPVVFDNQKVNVVFLVAIPNKLDAELSRVLSQVYDLIRSIAANSNIFNNLKNYDNNRGLIQLMEAI